LSGAPVRRLGSGFGGLRQHGQDLAPSSPCTITTVFRPTAGAGGNGSSIGWPRQAPSRISCTTTLRSPHRMAAVVAVLDLDLRLARIVADQPDAGAAARPASAADAHPLAAPEHLRRVHQRVPRALDQLVDLLGLTAAVWVRPSTTTCGVNTSATSKRLS